jgi:hypothetical protein
MSTPEGVENQSQKKKSDYLKRLLRNMKGVLVNPRFWVEILALIGLGLYVCETKRTNNLTQLSLTAGNIQFRSQERPYLAAESRFGGTISATLTPEQLKAHPEFATLQGVPIPWLKVPLGDKNFRITIAVDAKNWGRSPAIDVFVTKPKIIVGPQSDAKEQVLKYIPDYPKDATGALMPNQSFTIGSGPETEMPVINKVENDYIGNGSWEIYVVGGIRYWDNFSPRSQDAYETVYCFKVQTTGMPFSSCPIRATTIR